MLRVRIHGIDEIKETVSDLDDLLDDLSPIIREDVIPVVRERILRIFSSRGYGRWAPLRPSTIRGKGHDLPLVETRRLRRSLTNEQDPEAIIQVRRRSLTYGTEVPYARYHEFGTRRMPRRPFFEPLIEDTEFQDQLVRAVDRGITRRAVREIRES